MKIKTDAGNAPELAVDQARASRQTDGANATSSNATGISAGSDSIALSSTKDLVQRALSAGSETRLARILELRQQVQSNQYQVDPLAVSNALIDAHLAGG